MKQERIKHQILQQRILLNLGQGSWQTGFESITAQLWDARQQPVQFVGSLPPAPQLAEKYQHWRGLYKAIYDTHNHWRRAGDFDFEYGLVTNVSRQAFEVLCGTLQTDLNDWLMAATFAPIERRVRTHLRPQATIRVMLTAHDQSVLRFPWRLWHLFEDYPNAELSLSLPNYSRSLKHEVTQSPGVVKILAVLGNDQGIDVETDQQLLNQLPSAQVTLLAQPTLDDLQQCLWEDSWDVLFFAGHSSSRGSGYLQVNTAESLTIDQLKYALRRAIAKGLQLAVLNSCDGLGLAWALADLQLPQAIVMREPVPDAIAHQFLKSFLTTLSGGEGLYPSVREAREKLHGIAELGICASWLPVIVQNPAEEPPTWGMLAGQQPPESQLQIAALETAPETTPETAPESTKPAAHPLQGGTRRKQRRGLGQFSSLAWVSLAVATLVLGLRWVGLLQRTELWAYDVLLKLRPAELPDTRLVIVTIDEQDIKAQTSLERRGSLSDDTLQQLLIALNRYEPRVIGLDLYRDFPASRQDLAITLTQSNFIGICKSLDPVADATGIGPVPELAPTQVGFSDFIEETDGILRRQLLTLTPNPVSPCTADYGFATLVAIHYLQDETQGETQSETQGETQSSEQGSKQGASPHQATFTPTGDFQLGDTVLPRLGARMGGLQHFDNRGNQILLNYRALPKPDQIAAQIPLAKLLNGEVNPDSIRDRIVLIGVTATSGDYWSTPYGVQAQERTPGVFLQAQMVSQLISAVLDGRSLIWVWPQWVDAICVITSALIGSLLTWQWKAARLGIACLLTGSGLIIGAWAAFIVGGWLPLVPALLALGGSTLSLQAYDGDH